MRCEYPNGRMQQSDGTTFPIACDNSAVRNIDGWWFCADHAGMAKRGCLDGYYTDGIFGRQLADELNAFLWEEE
jgi:hypothetical protein